MIKSHAPSIQGEFGDFHSEKPTVLELATDALMLKMALYEGEGIEQAFRCYSEQFEEEYSRYWHGYVVILRAQTPGSRTGCRLLWDKTSCGDTYVKSSKAYYYYSK